MRKRTFNRRRWLHGEAGCNAYVLVNATWNPGKPDAEHAADRRDFLESELEISLGGRSTHASLYGSVLETETERFLQRLDELISTLTETRDWVRGIQKDFVRDLDREN